MGGKMQQRLWLALRVIDGEERYGLSYVELREEPDGSIEIIIEPYDGMERASTIFYSGTIRTVRRQKSELIFE